MTNTPESRRNFIKTHSDPKKQAVLEWVSKFDEYSAISTFRQQLYYIHQKAPNYPGILKAKITYEDLAEVFGIQKSTVGYHIQQYLKDKEDKEAGNAARKNGRPFSLTQKEIEQMGDFLKKHDVLKYSTLKKFCVQNFEKEVEYKCYIKALNILGYKLVTADPIEDKRFYVSQQEIEAFYTELKTFTDSHNIPSAFTFNLDEEGYDPFSIASRELIVVENTLADKNTSKGYYPVARDTEHSTFLAAINAYGDRITPMIITKRSTIECGLLLYNIGPDRVILGQSEKGYVTKELFSQYISEIFLPRVRELRAKYHYEGPAMLLMDGASVHFTSDIVTQCTEANIIIFHFPPHSSNQLQPLDLGVFHVHKEKMRHLNLDSYNDTKFVQVLRDLLASWEVAATPDNIQGAWKAMGCAYEIGGPSCTLVRFDMKYAAKLLWDIKSYEEKEEIRCLRAVHGVNKEVSPKRIQLSEFNKLYKYQLGEEYSCKDGRFIVHKVDKPDMLNLQESKEEKAQSIGKCKKILETAQCIKTEITAPPGSLARMFAALVPCEKVTSFPIKDNYHKWRPKENVEKLFAGLDFETKLKLELESLGLLPTDVALSKKKMLKLVSVENIVPNAIELTKPEKPFFPSLVPSAPPTIIKNVNEKRNRRVLPGRNGQK